MKQSATMEVIQARKKRTLNKIWNSQKKKIKINIDKIKKSEGNGSVWVINKWLCFSVRMKNLKI